MKIWEAFRLPEGSGLRMIDIVRFQHENLGGGSAS